MCGWTARPARSPTARELVKTKAGEWRTAFIDDEPGQGIGARSQIGAQRPQCIATQRMLGRSRPFKLRDLDATILVLYMAASGLGELARPKAVLEHETQDETIAKRIAALAGRPV